MHHYRKTWSRYLSHPRPTTCPFCDHIEMKPRILYETEHCFVIPNRVSYDIWELRDVLEHLLLIPKQHCKNFGELSADARHEIMDAIASYETNSYNIYARTETNTNRSIPHQHTHLIKTNDNVSNGMFLMRKPYLFVKF